MTNNQHFTPNTPRRIEILAYGDVNLLDVAGPAQVFCTANDLARLSGKPPPYDIRLVAEDAAVTASAGLSLAAGPLPEGAPYPDTVIAPGGYGVDGACRNPALTGWLDRRARHARRVASVCSGAYLLAVLGLLDGRRAVTHWSRCADLAARFPAVRVDPDPIFINDGNVWTSAGVTAGIDLALAFVEADLGQPAALEAARQMVVFLKRPGGQSQFSATLALQESGGRFDRLHAWIADHLDGDPGVPALAEKAGMSERSFVRAYGNATGITPAKAVERIRVEAARRMLEGGEAVKQTARRCGFGSEETLRRAFLRTLGTTPQDYRERFATKTEGHALSLA